jgi:hypothetical protein
MNFDDNSDYNENVYADAWQQRLGAFVESATSLLISSLPRPVLR